MFPKSDCDAYDLLDEAYSLSLAVRLEPEKVRKLIERLRGCAEKARCSGQTDVHVQLLTAASDLERRLAGSTA